MKKLLENMGWIDYRNRIDWREVVVDTTAFIILGLAIWLLYVCS